MKEIEEMLNDEYQDIGTISIEKMHEDTIYLSDIEFVGSIIEKIEPLASEEPIVLGKKYYWHGEYIVIDGYHRLKDKLNKREKTIKAIILDDYTITRKNDTLFEFISGLKGKIIKFIDSELLVANGKLYAIVPNEGCGGCGNGWSSFKLNPEKANKEMKVNKVEQKDGEYEDDYDLYINNQLIAKVDTGWGNGYYGGDFQINLVV